MNLPWKTNHGVLCDNYNLAEKRLHSTLRRLRKDPELAMEYKRIMKEQEDSGIIEEVKEDEVSVGKTCYMPHQPVIRNDKATS